MAWHSHVNLLAVSLVFSSGKSVILLHSLDECSTCKFTDPPLTHPKQLRVTCLQWKPLSGRVLAVGCQDCIIIWEMPSLLEKNWKSRKLIGCGKQYPVTSLEFCPRGRLLAAGSLYDSSITIWNMATERPAPIKRIGGGITCLSWSSDGTRLFSGYKSNTFRIWDTKSWKYVRESCDTFVKRCVWSSNGSLLLYIQKDLNYLYMYDIDQSLHGILLDLSLLILGLLIHSKVIVFLFY
ncbi:aladin-like [Zophobas morio]|uniref:aladin-like n=1 Tax=Zophobas morio TaxID=2755281 RepID=UPI0030835303